MSMSSCARSFARAFPTGDAAIKRLWVALWNINAKWEHNHGRSTPRFASLYEDRFNDSQDVE